MPRTQARRVAPNMVSPLCQQLGPLNNLHLFIRQVFGSHQNNQTLRAAMHLASTPRMSQWGNAE